MSLFGKVFGDKEETKRDETPVSTPKVASAPQGPVLNLQKSQILNLSKTSEVLNNVRLAAGWDVVDSGRDYDLDLCAYLLDEKGNRKDTVYYGDKHSRKSAIYLDGDNLTGEGEGDDENIYVTLNGIPSSIHQIVFGVVIYSGSSRNQYFKGVQNAYARLVNESTGNEVCRYNLSNEGGSNTAVVIAKLFRENGEWNFQAVGEFSQNSIESLGRSL